ncbi:MAG: SMC-Scp complex subunit ScpB [DPANN group archaeon]|nr:SMC-Scp complex subunit ScpB [DPANN group archaeon]
MPNVENMIEAVLFISARPMTLSEIAKVTGIMPKSKIKTILDNMKVGYGNHGIYIAEQDGLFELKVKKEHMNVVSSLAPDQDFSRAILQTLSIIAYKNPIKQSEIIDIRGNRAYDHLLELESRGFVVRVPSGHTNLVKITGKFLDYFGLTDKDELAKHFKSSEVLNNTEIPIENVLKTNKNIKVEYDSDVEKKNFHDKLKEDVEKRKKELYNKKDKTHDSEANI